MSCIHGLFEIKSKRFINQTVIDLTVECPQAALEARPGQFVHILPQGCTLRRPISICGIDALNGTLRMVFEIRGSGTETLSRLEQGQMLDMIAPLGNGFPEVDGSGRIILVGGGIGTPPMLSLAKVFSERATAICGFRSRENIILKEDFEKLGTKCIICTDDGTEGIRGLVTAPLEEECAHGDIAAIFACGPTPMLKAVANTAGKHNIECFVSLEERMGCGVGACLVCACKTKGKDGERMSRVCKDGPVFNAREVFF